MQGNGNDITRSALEEATKDQVISTALALRKSAVDSQENLLATERALMATRAQALEKFSAGRMAITDLVIPGVMFTTGEAINWFWKWLGSPPASGQQGMISAWVARNYQLLRSVPHLILGLGVAVSTMPTPSSGKLNDGAHEGGKALITGAATRLVDYWSVNRGAAQQQQQDLNAKLQQLTAQLQEAQKRSAQQQSAR